MLRRKDDSSYEFLEVRDLLQEGHAWAFLPRLEDRVRARIFSSLGPQDGKEPFIGLRASERWVFIPAGVGVAAMVLLALNSAREPDSRRDSSGEIVEGATTLSDLQPGQQFVASRHLWLDARSGTALGLTEGTAVVWARHGESVVLRFERGRLTVATGPSTFTVVGDGWHAEVSNESAAVFSGDSEAGSVDALAGTTFITAYGVTHTLRPGDPQFEFTGGTSPANDGRPSGDSAGDPAPSSSQRPSDIGSGTPPSDPGNGTPPSEPGNGAPPENPGNGTPPSDAGNGTPPSEPGNGTPPENPGNGTPPTDPGNGTPPENPGNGTPPENPGNGTPPTDPANGTPPTDPANGTPPTDPANGTPPTDPGNGTPPENPGNGTPPTDPGNGTPPSDPANGTPPSDPGVRHTAANPGAGKPPTNPGNGSH